MKKTLARAAFVGTLAFGAGCGLFAALWAATGAAWAKTCAITCGMFLYHLAIRVIGPLAVRALSPKAPFDPMGPWFRPRAWEAPPLAQVLKIRGGLPGLEHGVAPAVPHGPVRGEGAVLLLYLLGQGQSPVFPVDLAVGVEKAPQAGRPPKQEQQRPRAHQNAQGNQKRRQTPAIASLLHSTASSRGNSRFPVIFQFYYSTPPGRCPCAAYTEIPPFQPVRPDPPPSCAPAENPAIFFEKALDPDAAS